VSGFDSNVWVIRRARKGRLGVEVVRVEIGVTVEPGPVLYYWSFVSQEDASDAQYFRLRGLIGCVRGIGVAFVVL
jgi:hypothetical protein